MPKQGIKNKTAIVGIGFAAFTRRSGISTLSWTGEASVKAIVLARGNSGGIRSRLT